MSDTQQREISHVLDRIAKCISGNLKKPLLLEYKGSKLPHRLKGMKIPFILAYSYFQKLTHPKNPFLGSCLNQQQYLSLSQNRKQTIEETCDCLHKQDFHLLPFKQRLLEKNLTLRQIVKWKISKAFFLIKHFDVYIKFFSQKPCDLAPHSIEILSKNEKDKNKKSEEKAQLELFEVDKYKEERHFPMTRIIDYFSK